MKARSRLHPLRWMTGFACAVVVGTLCVAAGAKAASPAPQGPGALPPRLELRYQHLTSTLRCPVCQNEPIATSDAKIAGDLRRIVRRKLLAGESNAQIRHYMVSRYGLFAIYKPPVQGSTLLLWFGPALLLLIALIVSGLAIRKRRRTLSSPERS